MIINLAHWPNLTLELILAVPQSAKQFEKFGCDPDAERQQLQHMLWWLTKLWELLACKTFGFISHAAVIFVLPILAKCQNHMV